MCILIKPIIEAEALDDYKLKLTFENGEIKVADFKEYAFRGGIFKPLENPAFFKRVSANGDTCVIWPQDIDFCGGCLYEDSIPYAEYLENEKVAIETDLTEEELAELDEAGEEYRKNPASIIPLEAVLKEEYQI